VAKSPSGKIARERTGRYLTDGSVYRALAAEVYRPEKARLIILGEAPPPEKFFYFGDSLFFQYLRRAFFSVLPETEQRDKAWFLTLFREIGGWRIDICEEPQRGTKGGADDVTPFLNAFMLRWHALPRTEDAIVVASPKRLVPVLPEEVKAVLAASVPPPGQWNSLRRAFLTEMDRVLRQEIGQKEIQAVAAGIDPDMATLEFEIAMACAEGQGDGELRRLIKGHPREKALLTVWQRASWQSSADENADQEATEL
jgi:hypothetical protein